MNNIVSQLSLIKTVDAKSLVVPTGDPVYCYWLHSSIDSDLETAVRAIRSQPRFALVPIFTEQAGNLQTQALTDGCLTNIHDVSEAAHALHNRASTLGIDLSTHYSENDRLVRFLLTRPIMKIEPISDWKHETSYRYPLLECLANDGQSIHSWIKHLEESHLIEQIKLVDRTRHCTQCESTHLNYLDVCPHCHEIDINKQKFVHCFSCGNVAPDQDFMHAGIMQCKVCNQGLKHIGVDYDRPLESYACSACKNRFEEPLVIAKCLSCEQVDTPDKLSSRQVATYKLSEKGRINALKNADEANKQTTNHSEFMVQYDVLQKFLSWNLAVLRQNPAHAFSLINIRITNSAKLRQQLGEPAANKLIKHFTNLVGQSIRDTDMASCDPANAIWLLLSPADEQTSVSVLKQINALCVQTLNDDNVGIEVQAKVVKSLQDLAALDSTNTLLGYKDE